MDDISRAAEVCDYGYCAGRESFEDYACAVVANGWKHHQVSRSHAPEDFRMANPTTEGNSLLDFKGSRELLEAVPLRAIADYGEAGQIGSQKGSYRPQSKITGLYGDQPTDENQLKFGAGLRTPRLNGTHGRTDAGLGDEKQLVGIRGGKLRVGLGRRGYDCCGATISGPSKRQKTV
jgi:hypothetical protein